MAVSLHPIQTAPIPTTATTPVPALPATQTPQSPASRPSTADSTLKSPTSATPAGGAQEKRKTSRRANTAERRATHNAVERQRRETLNGRFLDLASLLPNLTSVRRPSKSAIVNSSIALIHQSRRQKSLASLELRALYTQFLALKAEADEWRARAGVNPFEEGERSREFWEMIREGEEVLKSGMGAGESGGMKEAMRRVREVGEEEGRARVLAEAASSTSHGARRDLNDEDDEELGMEEEHSPEPPTVVPVPASVAALAAVQHQQQQQMNAAHLAHQQHLAQVHAAAQAQLVHQQQAQQQQAQQQQQQMMMRARAASINTVPQQQAQFAYGLPQQHVPQVQHHHHQVHVPQVQVVPHMYHQQQQQQQVQIPFDSGADLFPTNSDYSSSNLFDNKSTVNEWVNFATSAMASPPMYEDSASSSGGSSPSPVVGVVRSRSGSLTTAGGMPVSAGFY